MTNFSRKKIRGFKRKIRQLDKWRNSIVSFPFDKMKDSGEIFRVHLHPFNWYGDQNPDHKFLRHIYKAYQDILIRLKDNKALRKNEMTAQLWLFYPRTVKSLVIVAPKDLHKKRNDQINAAQTKENPPRIIKDFFNNYTFRIGVDKVFKSNKPQTENPDWQTNKLGDIWITE